MENCSSDCGWVAREEEMRGWGVIDGGAVDTSAIESFSGWIFGGVVLLLQVAEGLGRIVKRLRFLVNSV